MADPITLTLPLAQGLQSAEQIELLDAIDPLRARGLGAIVDFPQLIVCGDQSCGKSSVLTALSGIPFSRKDTLCTRFVTEAILRRASNDKISVSIVPGKDRGPDDRAKLMKFQHEIETQSDLDRLFDSAADAMGLSSPGDSFSDDILRIEFCGPSQPQLTLVDLPGIIRTESDSQKTGHVEPLHDLVNKYLKSPRSIILAVVSAVNDISSQRILSWARKVDPHGSRTLGIITKPDTLVVGSKNETAFINLAEKEDVAFSLGWHVVKNQDSALQNNQSTIKVL
jgi:GTPase SAR1 family protein